MLCGLVLCCGGHDKEAERDKRKGDYRDYLQGAGIGPVLERIGVAVITGQQTEDVAAYCKHRGDDAEHERALFADKTQYAADDAEPGGDKREQRRDDEQDTDRGGKS